MASSYISKVLEDSHLQLDSQQQTLTNSSTVLNQIGLLVTKHAEDKGLNMIITPSSSAQQHASLANQRPALVLTSLKQLLKCCEDEVKETRQGAGKSGKDLEEMRREFGEYKLKVSQEHRTK